MLTNPEFLSTNQYATSANLDARIAMHALYSTNPYGWFPWLFDQIEPQMTGLVLELGCGQGDLWRINSSRQSLGFEALLSDLSAGMVSQARQNLRKLPFHPKFAVIDAGLLPFKTNTFDVILANHMLYHVPDLDKALGEIWRVMKPGGMLAATTVGVNHLCEITDLEKEFISHSPGQFLEWELDFTLENGEAILGKYFELVELRLYEDRLLVRAPEPLADYILSSAKVRIPPEARRELINVIGDKISRNGGALPITKDSGLFICIKK